jgi:hypothetical protein
MPLGIASDAASVRPSGVLHWEPMRVAAMLSQVGDRWLAQCEEVDRAGEGRTAEEAIASLREALEEYFGHAEAVAPPAQPPRESIEIVVVDAPPGTSVLRGTVTS